MKASEVNFSVLKAGLIKGTLVHIPLFILFYSYLNQWTLHRKVGSFWLGLIMIASVKYLQHIFPTSEKEGKPLMFNSILLVYGIIFIFINELINGFAFTFFFTFVFSLVASTLYLVRITKKKYNRHHLIMSSVFASLVGTNILSLIFEQYTPLYTSSLVIANIFMTVTAFMVSMKIGMMWEDVALKKTEFSLEDTLNGIFAKYIDSILILSLFYYGLAIIFMPLLKKSNF